MADWSTCSSICLPSGCSVVWWSAFGDQRNSFFITFSAASEQVLCKKWHSISNSTTHFRSKAI